MLGGQGQVPEVRIKGDLHYSQEFLSFGHELHPPSAQRLTQFPCVSSAPLIQTHEKFVIDKLRSGAHEVQLLYPAHVLQFLLQIEHKLVALAAYK